MVLKLAPLLAPLAKALASERQSKRVEACLRDIQTELENHHSQIRDLTDAQYKLINEAVLALLQTTQSEKINYLRAAVSNSLHARDIKPQEAILLSRIIRDISADEVSFVRKFFGYKEIILVKPPEIVVPEDRVEWIDPESAEALTVSGLLSLGILVPATFARMGSPPGLAFTSITAKLIALLQDSPRGRSDAR